MPAKKAPKTSTLDKACSDLIREAWDYVCANCERSFRHEPEKFHWAHLDSRLHRASRWHLTLGAIGLCQTCHWHYTTRPIAWTKFLVGLLGQATVDEAEALSHSIAKWTKADKIAIRKHIKAEAERVKTMRAMGHQGRIELVPYE